MRRAALVLAGLLGLAGCGGGGESGSTTQRTGSPPVPSAEAEPPTATAPSAPAPPPDAGVLQGHGVEEQEGGAGDEEEARTPVVLAVDGEGMTPRRLVVPAFIALRITVRNDLSRPIRVRGAGADFAVPARARWTVKAGGLRPGRHPVRAGRAGRAVLVAR